MSSPKSLNHPYVLILTGPAGAGKSTIAEAWANTRDHPCAHVELDRVRSFVRSGFVNPVDGWNDETQRQLDLARGSVAMLARRYVEADFSCVIDDAVFPEWAPSGFDRWLRELDGLTPHLIVLLPSLDRCIERNADREGEDVLPEQMVRRIYGDMSPWLRQADVLVIDNGELSVEDAVRAIEAALS